MNRQPLTMNMTIVEMCMIMSEYQREATAILQKMATSMPLITVGIRLLDLDDMNIRGTQIAIAYEHCKNDMIKFIDAISERDACMVDAVNARMKEYPEGTPMATTGSRGCSSQTSKKKAKHLVTHDSSRFTQNSDNGFVRGAKVRR